VFLHLFSCVPNHDIYYKTMYWFAVTDYYVLQQTRKFLFRKNPTACPYRNRISTLQRNINIKTLTSTICFWEQLHYTSKGYEKPNSLFCSWYIPLHNQKNVFAQIKPRNHTYKDKGGERIKKLSGITSTHPMITPQENDFIRMHISQLYNLQEKTKLSQCTSK